MLRMLNRYRDELQVTAPSADLELAADLTEEHLRTETAEFGSLDVRFDGGAVVVDGGVRNLAGHKLPTAYPSRRAWIHLTARDQMGRTIFESGAPQVDGAIAGNANDEDGGAFEPHYTEITAPDQVQIYEPIIGDSNGNVTTALLRGVRYLKDNRLLPEGSDKAVLEEDVAVQGATVGDADFTGGSDRGPLPTQGGRRRHVGHRHRAAAVPDHRLSVGAESGGLRRVRDQPILRLLRGQRREFRHRAGRVVG